MFQQIKAILKLSEVIGGHTPVNSKGWALCPFHNDRKPSLKVDDDKGFWFCFPCGEGGDHFTFIEKLHKCDRAGSLKILADMAGISLDMDPVQRDQVRKIMKEVKIKRQDVEVFVKWCEAKFEELISTYRALNLEAYTIEWSEQFETRNQFMDRIAPLYHARAALESGIWVLTEGTPMQQFEYFKEMRP